MIKLMEFTIKSKKEIDFNSPDFEMIKKKTKQEIEDKLEKELVDISAFQCNCSKSYDDENNTHLLLIKVYGWPLEFEETNFFINTDKIEKEVNYTTSDDFTIEVKEQVDFLTAEKENLEEKIELLYNSINSKMNKKRTKKEDIELIEETKLLGMYRSSVQEKTDKINFYKREYNV